MFPQPLQYRRGWEERAGEDLGGGGKDSRTIYPAGLATPEKERSEMERFEVPDFLLLTPSAYQPHNAKSLRETLRRKKKKIS